MCRYEIFWLTYRGSGHKESHSSRNGEEHLREVHLGEEGFGLKCSELLTVLLGEAVKVI
jgi:hypothetical protein